MMSKLGALLVGVVALITNEYSQVWARPQVGPEGVQVRRDGELEPLDFIEAINEVNGPLNPAVSTFTGNDEVQLTSGFDPLVPFPGAEAELGIAASQNPNFGRRPVLSVDSSVPDDVILKVPVGASPNFDLSLDQAGIPSFPSVKLDSVDDVQLTLSDPTLASIGPVPSGKTSGQRLPSLLPGDISGGNFPGVDANINTGFGQESSQDAGKDFGVGNVNQFGPVPPTPFGGDTQSQGNFGVGDVNQFGPVPPTPFGGDTQPQGNFGVGDVDQFGPVPPTPFGGNTQSQGNFGVDVNQFGPVPPTPFGGNTQSQGNFGVDANQFGPVPQNPFGGNTQFQGNVAPSYDGSDVNQFAGTGSTQSAEFSNSGLDSLNVPSANVPNVQPVKPHRTLGDGGKLQQKILPNPKDLLALLVPGLAAQQQSVQRNPLEKIFNLLTLGIFEGRQSGPNPLRDFLSPIISGIFGNGGQRGLDLSIIGLGDDAIGELAQVASAGLDDFARETTTGIQLAQDEVRFQSGEKLRQLISNLQQTGRTFSVVGQNTYRSLLQKQDALAKMLMGIVTNLGSYVNTSVGNTFEKIGSTANTFGKFINDLKVGFLNSLISRGEATRELFSGTLDTVGTAFKDFTSAAQAAAEDNIKAITGLKSNRKFR